MRLHLSKAEFFDLTPRLFAALRRQMQSKDRELQILIAALRMDTINFSMCRPKEPVKLDDLLPRWEGGREGQALAPSKKLNRSMRREIGDSCRRLFGSLVVENKSR